MKSRVLKYIRRRSKLKLIHLGFALLICVFISQLNLDFFEGWTYNFRVKSQINFSVSDKIQLVKIKDKTLPDLNKQIEVLEKILKSNPDYVVYFINAESLTGSHQSTSRFVELVNSNPKVMLARDTPEPEKSKRSRHPLSLMTSESAIVTLDKLSFAKDNVTRRLILHYGNKDNVHLKIAKNYNGKSLKDYDGAFKYYSSKQAYFKYSPPGSFPDISFKKLYRASNKDVNPLMKNKIVFVGVDNNVDSDYYATTPYSKSLIAFTRLELQANFLNTLLKSRIVTKSPKWLNYVTIVFISLLTVYAVFTVKPIRGLYILFATFLVYSMIGYISFTFFDYWIEMAPAFLTIFLCYYFFIPYRLIKENKKSWEYQEHNKMLSKVEELKTNFMRMMSHDLKTPLARIQGLADVVAKGDIPLGSQQKEALKNIYKSSADLTVFIESILDLSRVESNEVKLHLQSRDLNTLLTQVIKKCEFLAKKKDITIITEFEPIFSVKVDEGLLKQVFVNLIENAIKYSEPGTRVLVSSEEFDNKIIIQVADQGKGIKEDEQEHVFDKFYRAKEDQSSEILGTGLGLYLSKYFVELHQGDIQVDSDENKGSTFTVNLPMNL